MDIKGDLILQHDGRVVDVVNALLNNDYCVNLIPIPGNFDREIRLVITSNEEREDENNGY